MSLNIWSDDIGAEAADFIRYPAGAGKSVTTNKQNVFMATISGNTAGWFSLPGDPGPIGVVVGYEYREVDANINTPDFMEQGLFEGGGLAPVAYSLDEKVDFSNVIVEAVVPLLSGKPGIDFLELELGLRSSEHSLTGRDNTYKMAIAYYPNEDLQIRVHTTGLFGRLRLMSCFNTTKRLVIYSILVWILGDEAVADGQGNSYRLEATLSWQPPVLVPAFQRQTFMGVPITTAIPIAIWAGIPISNQKTLRPIVLVWCGHLTRLMVCP